MSATAQLLRPLRMAVLFDQRVSAGGGFQQSVNAALLVSQLPPDLVRPVFLTTLESNLAELKAHGIEATYLNISRFDRFLLRLRHLVKTNALYHWIKKFQRLNALDRQLSELNIDLVYFLSSSMLGHYLERTNYITTVWDLCHLDAPEFPEVRDDFQFEIRETLYSGLLRKSVAILVDSAPGQANAARRYGVDMERIHIMPFAPAPGVNAVRTDTAQIDIRGKYDLACPYVYYPAQFWAHKNHTYLLLGLRRLEELHGHAIGAIFSGGDMGNLAHIKQQAETLGLSERVRFAGYVPGNEIPVLYQQALALVMPTYFGPTNLPPLEAFLLGVPVLYPDLPGLRDQVGGAALLIDLKVPDSLAHQLARLLDSPGLRNQLIDAGKVQLDLHSDEARIETWKKILQEFRLRRICWAD
jgi:glycosyltransferase involved in cell wall biosynthesis